MIRYKQFDGIPHFGSWPMKYMFYLCLSKISYVNQKFLGYLLSSIECCQSRAKMPISIKAHHCGKAQSQAHLYTISTQLSPFWHLLSQPFSKLLIFLERLDSGSLEFSKNFRNNKTPKRSFDDAQNSARRSFFEIFEFWNFQIWNFRGIISRNFDSRENQISMFVELIFG